MSVWLCPKRESGKSGTKFHSTQTAPSPTTGEVEVPPSFRFYPSANIYWLFLVNVTFAVPPFFPQNRCHAGLVPTGPVLTRLNFSVWGDTLPPPFVLNVIYQFWFYNLVVLSLCGIWRVETYFLPPHDFHWAFNWHGTPCVFTADPQNLLSSLLPHNLFL